MKASRTEGLRRTERGWTGVVARDPRSYDLPDFLTLGDGPYPPILLEAFERAGNGFRRWSEQVEPRLLLPSYSYPGTSRAGGPGHGGGAGRLLARGGARDDVLLVACGSRRAARCRSPRYLRLRRLC